MAIVERSLGPNSLKDIKTTARIAIDSFSTRFPREIPEYKAVSREAVTTEVRYPINVEEDVLNGVMQIANQRKLSDRPFDYSRLYWAPDQQYNPQHVFQAIIQYPDFHSFPPAKTAFPPEADVKEFMDNVFFSNTPLTIPDQLDIALDISGNNITGAANLAAIATRYGARGYEKKAYPNIEIGPNELREWQKKIAQFEVYDNSGLMDGPGDTYYFWTHVYGALAYKSLEGSMQAAIAQALLEIGTPLMRSVRQHVARNPLQTPHHEPSVIGRDIGLALAEEIGVSYRS